jgi:hypothetical protein
VTHKKQFFDNWLVEDHVGLCILYCPTTVLTLMTLWKWLLSQMIIDGYPLGEHLNIQWNPWPHTKCRWCGSNWCEEKKYSFYKKQWNVVDFEGLISRIEKVLFKEFVHNVFVTMCCAMNCCQHFPHEKTLLLKQGTFTKIRAIKLSLVLCFSCFHVKNYINITHFKNMF